MTFLALLELAREALVELVQNEPSLADLRTYRLQRARASPHDRGEMLSVRFKLSGRWNPCFIVMAESR